MQQNRERAIELLKKMTVEEKVAQLVSAWLEIDLDGSFAVREYGAKESLKGDLRKQVLGKGIGQLTRPFGTMANEAQYSTVFNRSQFQTAIPSHQGIRTEIIDPVGRDFQM